MAHPGVVKIGRCFPRKPGHFCTLFNNLAYSVYYLGESDRLSDIPKQVKCTKWATNGFSTIEEAAIRLSQDNSVRFDCVLSLSEYQLETAARIRAILGVNGQSLERVLQCRNKLTMKNLISRASITVPRNAALADFLKGRMDSWSGKTVLKPVDGASSVNVRVFNSAKEVRAAVYEAKTGIEEFNESDISTYEVEEFVSGDILHFDGIVVNGQIRVFVGSCYIGDCLRYTLGNPLGSYQIDNSDKYLTWAQRCLDAVELYNGSFHLEAIANETRTVFLEVANRVGGADVVRTVELATGVHLPSEELKLYLGNSKLDSFSPAANAKYGWFVMPGHHLGRDRCQVVNFDKFTDDSRMVDWYCLDPSQPVSKNITYQAGEVPLSGLVRSTNSSDLRSFISSIFAEVSVI